MNTDELEKHDLGRLREFSEDPVFANMYKGELHIRELLKEKDIVDSKVNFNTHSTIYSDTLKYLYLSGGIMDKKVLANIVSTEASYKRILPKLVNKKYVYTDGKFVILAAGGYRIFKPFASTIEKLRITDNKSYRAEQYSRLLMLHINTARMRILQNKINKLDNSKKLKLAVLMYKTEAYKQASKFYQKIKFSDDDIKRFENTKTHTSVKKKMFNSKFIKNFEYKTDKSFKKYFDALQESIANKEYLVFDEYYKVSHTEIIQDIMLHTTLFNEYKLYSLYDLSRREEYYDEVENRNRIRDVQTFQVNKEIEDVTRKLKSLGGLITASKKSNNPQFLPSELKELRTSLLKEKNQLEEMMKFTVGDIEQATTLNNLAGQGYFLERAVYSKKKSVYQVRVGILTYQSSTDREFLYKKLKLLINFYNELFGDTPIEFHFNVYTLFNNSEYIEKELKKLVDERLKKNPNEYAVNLQRIKYTNLSEVL